ncbi:MAG: hypothetical protein KJ621_17320 [Proteobacteria bacterium]|nr:hypothetical protein [Pseudomonadota bacterium]MBU1742097.1 hypothetical protein [Pseudomonadota bacterium]
MGIRLAVAIGWAAVAAALVLIPLILFPAAQRTAAFWPRVLWAEFLNLIWWGVLGVGVRALRRRQDLGLGGAVAAWSLVTGAYALTSFVLMILHALVPGGSGWDRIHLVVQIMVAVIAVLAAVFVFLARRGASPGSDRPGGDVGRRD